MRLWLTQPAVHNLSCLDCMAFVYDPTRGWELDLQNDKPRRRSGPPPCGLCPKKSPAQAWRFELSAKNRGAVAHFIRHRAMGFRALTEDEAADPIVQRNFEIIDGELRRYERESQSHDAMMMLQGVMSGITAKPTP